jgi:hypothetical protein
MRGGLARALGEALQSRQSDDSELDTHQVLLRILNQQFTGKLEHCSNSCRSTNRCRYRTITSTRGADAKCRSFTVDKRTRRR